MDTGGEGRRGKERMEERVTKEEWCCVCYGGGLLLFCAQKDCIKACHLQCMVKDDSLAKSGISWTCDAHSCFICHKRQDFNCVGCPKALCRLCIGKAEFVQIKGNKGLCRACLTFGLLVEEKKDADFDKQFMEHFGSAWKIITERESLTVEDLHCAEDRMKKGKFYMPGCDSEENDEGVKSGGCATFPKKPKKPKKKNEEENCSIPLLQYALIDPKNITLVYLKKRLVEKLVKEPRTLADEKLIGSFVKIKAARNDRLDQNIFKLLQITGTTWNCCGENDPEVLLHVSGMENNISIDLLSDGCVNEYECKDLKIRIQRGLLKQPTVDELENKARILHEDITKHWITTELERLKMRFELAFERGRRGEMIEFEKKWDRLLTTEEQENILNTVHHVVAAAEGELELLSKNSKDVEQENDSSLKTPSSDESFPDNKGAEENGPPLHEQTNLSCDDVGIGGDYQNVDEKVKDLSTRLDRVDLKTYSRRNISTRISPSNDGGGELEKVESSAATEGKSTEDNIPPMGKQGEALLPTLGQS